MSRRARAVQTTVVIIAAAIAIACVPMAHAQRGPRSGVLVDPDAQRPVPAHPNAPAPYDLRLAGQRRMPLYPLGSNTGNPVVVYVVPGYGYGYPPAGYGYPPRGYDPSATTRGAYDTNGRPLSIGFEAGPAYDAVPSYTPDLSGLPYLVIEGGAMMVELPNGERRTFPSCAASAASADPAGRPRTVFYSGTADGVILREGQRGRVQGTPTAAACYAVDAGGRIALRP